MFHSALCANFGGDDEWYGYAPIKHRSTRGPGSVHRDDRSAFINHEITFIVDDTVLRSGIDRACVEYRGTTYTVTIHDCVSFTAQVARNIGLSVTRGNLTPYGFILSLAAYNSYEMFK